MEKAQGDVGGMKFGKAVVEMGAIYDVLTHTMAMFTLPFLVFYATDYICKEHLQLSSRWQLFTPLILSILSVQLVIISFVRIGYKQAVEDDKALKTSHTTSSSNEDDYDGDENGSSEDDDNKDGSSSSNNNSSKKKKE
eukprot:m.14401 g.14401  ORF g.14401 m.14401 type:complete len:138 (-) comp4302_c0_seq1:1376-1789(-)